MMTVLGVLLVLFGGFAFVKAFGLWRRHRGRALIPREAVVREVLAVDLRVVLFRTHGFLSLAPGPSHPARGDLVLSSEAVVLASDLGLLLHLHEGCRATLTSARCTGPGRLVLEGQVDEDDIKPGRYRYELVVTDPNGWVAALAPWVRPDPDTPAFGSVVAVR